MHKKRQKNWWEPVFEKSYQTIPVGVWPAKTNKIVSNLVLDSTSSTIPNVVVDTKFVRCDFQGLFENKIKRFINCTFERCDFGDSKWYDVQFKDCRFEDVSFTVSSFYDCEFRDCAFNGIQYSGNTTKIDKTLITNPYDFIEGAKVYADHLPNHVSKRYQKLKLLDTKSTMSRILLSNVSSEGSERTYYNAVMIAILSSCRSRHVDAALRLYKGKRYFSFRDLESKDLLYFLILASYWISGKIEEVVFRFVGFINAWGSSVFRSVFIGIIVNIFFSILYYTFDINASYYDSFIKSTEVMFLFGYTNHTSGVFTVLPLGVMRAILLSNALSGLMWYAVAIPTFVNRVTRTRG